MNTTKTVFNKLYSKKTELETHKIELNVVEDTIKKAAKIGSKILSLESDILSNANVIKKLSDNYNQFINQFKDFEQKAKDLGIDKVAKEASEAIKFYTNKCTSQKKDEPGKTQHQVRLHQKVVDVVVYVKTILTTLTVVMAQYTHKE